MTYVFLPFVLFFGTQSSPEKIAQRGKVFSSSVRSLQEDPSVRQTLFSPSRPFLSSSPNLSLSELTRSLISLHSLVLRSRSRSLHPPPDLLFNFSRCRRTTQRWRGRHLHQLVWWTSSREEARGFWVLLRQRYRSSHSGVPSVRPTSILRPFDLDLTRRSPSSLLRLARFADSTLEFSTSTSTSITEMESRKPSTRQTES